MPEERKEPEREERRSPVHRLGHALRPAPAAAPAGAAATLDDLRRAIARIEDVDPDRLDAGAGTTVQAAGLYRTAGATLALGAAVVDEALGGGLPRQGMIEIHGDDTRGIGPASGFVLAVGTLLSVSPARPLVWIGEDFAFAEAGRPYWPGLAALGFDPAALLLVRTRRLEEAIWASEEAARSRSPGLAVLEVRGNPARLSLEGTRRLHVRARDAGIALLILRQGGRAETTAAPCRLRIRAGPAAAVPKLGQVPKLIGHPVLDIAVEKSRTGREQRLLLEWNPHERRFETPGPVARPDSRSVAAASFDGPDQTRGDRTVVALRRAS